MSTPSERHGYLVATEGEFLMEGATSRAAPGNFSMSNVDPPASVPISLLLASTLLTLVQAVTRENYGLVSELSSVNSELAAVRQWLEMTTRKRPRAGAPNWLMRAFVGMVLTEIERNLRQKFPVFWSP